MPYDIGRAILFVTHLCFALDNLSRAGRQKTLGIAESASVSSGIAVRSNKPFRLITTFEADTLTFYLHPLLTAARYPIRSKHCCLIPALVNTVLTVDRHTQAIVVERC